MISEIVLIEVEKASNLRINCLRGIWLWQDPKISQVNFCRVIMNSPKAGFTWNPV